MSPNKPPRPLTGEELLMQIQFGMSIEFRRGNVRVSVSRWPKDFTINYPDGSPFGRYEEVPFHPASNAVLVVGEVYRRVCAFLEREATPIESVNPETRTR